MPPKQINLDQVPKQFSERIIVGSTNQFFILMPVVGTNATAYALTPEHAKSLAKILQQHIEKFEKDFRPISDTDSGVPSPIRRSDLPPSSEGKGSSKS